MPTNIQLIESLYAAFRSGDFDTFRSLCTPTLEWIQNKGFPYGGHHVGPEATIKGVFQTLPLHWDGWKYDIDEMFDAGHRVVVLGAYEGTHKVTGKSFRADTAHVFDIKEGKIERFRQYTDSALVRDAVE